MSVPSVQESILVDVEYILYVISQDITSEGKYELLALRDRLHADSTLDPATRASYLVWVEAACDAMVNERKLQIASWNLWKMHRALTGRTW